MLLMISNIRQFRYNRELPGCLSGLAAKGKTLADLHLCHERLALGRPVALV